MAEGQEADPDLKRRRPDLAGRVCSSCGRVTESFDDFPGESLNTLELREEGGKTTITATVLYPTREVRDAVINSGMPDGAAQSYDRLAEDVRQMS